MLNTALLALAASVTQVPDTAVAVQSLDEAKVTALRNTAQRSSAPVQTVSAADIQLRGAVALEEVLRSMTGVNVKDYGGIGGLKTVSLRNFGAQHTGFSLDGVAISDAVNGQIDISRFNLADVESIRVEMTGSDDIFRPARLASYVGVVSLATDTQPGQRPARQVASLRYGSFNTVSPYLHLRYDVKQQWRFGAAGSYTHSDGDYPFKLTNGSLVTDEVRLNSQVNQANGEVYATGNFGRGGVLRLKGSTFYNDRGLPGSVILYTQHPTEYLKDRNLSASALYSLDRNRWRLKASLAYNNAWNSYKDLARSEAPDLYTQQQGSLSAVALWQPVDVLSFSLAEDVEIAHLTSNIPESVEPTRNTSFTALSAKFATPRFTAVGTLLGLLMWEETDVPVGGPPVPSTVKSRLSPSLSASLGLLPDGFASASRSDLRLRASYKESYRLPSFTDLYYLRVGNRFLRPERAEQFNVGLTWLKNWGEQRLSASADAYYNNVRDKIVAVPSMFIWSMRNVGHVEMRGLDFAASYAAPLAPWLSLQADANYSLQYALDVTDPDAKNYRHQIAYTPRHSGSGVVALLMPWVNVSYTLTAVGERYALAQNTPAYRVEPYCDHSVSLNRTFELPHVSLHVSAEALNLAGRNYEIIKYYPMPGRQWRLTLRASF